MAKPSRQNDSTYISRQRRCKRRLIPRVFLKMTGGGTRRESEKRKRESRETGRSNERVRLSYAHAHTRGPALVKRSAIPRDIVPALNQVRLPLNCWLTLSQVHGRIRKTKESLTSNRDDDAHGTAAHSNELLAVAKMTTRTGTAKTREEEIEPDSTRRRIKPAFPRQFLFLSFRLFGETSMHHFPSISLYWLRDGRNVFNAFLFFFLSVCACAWIILK